MSLSRKAAPSFSAEHQRDASTGESNHPRTRLLIIIRISGKRLGLVKLDLRGERIEQIAQDQIAPSALPLRFTDKFGYTFVDITVDATALLVGFDTGAPHSVWLGVDGQPGDTPISSVDGFGNPITLYLGTGMLELPDFSPYQVPMLRILHHASLEASNQAIGIEARGLFGLTSLPGPSLVFDAAQGVIWLELE